MICYAGLRSYYISSKSLTQTTPMNNLPAPRTPNDSNTRINQDKKKKNKKKKPINKDYLNMRKMFF